METIIYQGIDTKSGQLCISDDGIELPTGFVKCTVTGKDGSQATVSLDVDDLTPALIAFDAKKSRAIEYELRKNNA